MQLSGSQSVERSTAIPSAFELRAIVRRLVQVLALLGLLGLVALLAPGLDEVRSELAGADTTWLAVAVVLEGLSCVSYVVMFGPVFCARMPWRRAYELGFSELAVGSLVPASGAGGLALGAWALRKGGMAVQDIARRTVAFFTLKSAANFFAVAVLGTLMFAGVGPELSPLLTILPAALAAATIAAVLALPSVLRRAGALAERGGRWVTTAAVLGTLAEGVVEARRIVRSGDWRVISGSLGYWAFDNAVLWACFMAFGGAPAVTVVLMAYLLGQMGGLLPLPGGVGGMDGGLIGALVLFGVPVASAAAAVLAYRVILFWLPLIAGGGAFVALRRRLVADATYDPCGCGRPAIGAPA